MITSKNSSIINNEVALILPLFVLFAITTALTVGLFLMQFWLFVTPVSYSSSLMPETWCILYGLNPMAGVVKGFHWTLLGKTIRIGALMLVLVLVVAVPLIGGLVYFRRMEKTFADVV